jgi:hypothetical protein
VVYVKVLILFEKYKVLKDYFSLFIKGFAIREMLVEVIEGLSYSHNEEITGLCPATCDLTICRHLFKQLF